MLEKSKKKKKIIQQFQYIYVVTSKQGTLKFGHKIVYFVKVWGVSNRTNHTMCSNKRAALEVQPCANMSSDAYAVML